jgi:hypothetical protein
MITIGQRTKLKKILKSGYSKEVQAVLKEKNILNKKGFSFGESYIRHVFNGINSNSDIEDAIFLIYQKRYNELSKKRIERRELLKKTVL